MNGRPLSPLVLLGFFGLLYVLAVFHRTSTTAWFGAGLVVLYCLWWRELPLLLFGLFMFTYAISAIVHRSFALWFSLTLIPVYFGHTRLTPGSRLEQTWPLLLGGLLIAAGLLTR